MILNIKYFIKLFKKLRDIYLVKIKWRNYHIDKNFHAGRGVNLWARNNIIIGKNFYIGRYSLIECDAIIGDDVIIANYVALIGKYDHNYHQIGIYAPCFKYKIERLQLERIEIKNYYRGRCMDRIWGNYYEWCDN